MNKSTFNKFIFFKLPLAWIAGIRLQKYDGRQCQTRIKFRWINQNPFRSIFWAAEGMAAELSTGTLCISKIMESGKKISMLMIDLKGSFQKKAVGRIIFTCNQGEDVDKAIQKAIETGEGQTVVLKSTGHNEAGEQVAEFDFMWSFKLKE